MWLKNIYKKMTNELKLWSILSLLGYFDVIKIYCIVSIFSNDYDMPGYQYDDANVLSQMMLKTPVAVP